MNKFLFCIIFLVFCLLPKISFGDDGKCIEGDCVNGKGVYLYSNGKKYESEFKNGEINKFGTPTYPEGRKYVGEFKEGVSHGYGSMAYPDGTQCIGDWLNGKLHGQGRLISAEKFEYIGEFANGVRHGQGTLIIVGGITYVGRWENDLPNGNGSMTYPDGTQYKGNWLNGKPHGQGKLISVGKFKYTGEFANGVRHGQGTLEMLYGITYKGQWSNDLPNGQGVLIQTDGMLISGEFKNGLVYGSGMKVLPDGNQVKRHGDEIDWYLISSLDKTQQLSDQESQESASNMEVFIAGESTPSPKILQSAVAPEKVAPQSSKVNEVIVKNKLQTKAIIEIKPGGVNKIKPKASTPVEKEDKTELQVKLSQDPDTSKSEEYATIAVRANIRSGASLTAEVLRTVSSGYPVAVLETQKDWLLVKDFRGKKGWVYRSLVREPSTVIIKVSKGNLRSGPGLKDNIVDQLDHGTIMSVLQRNGEWVKVSDLEHLTGGWLHSKIIWPEAEMNTR